MAATAQSTDLNQIRALAQHHLTEIESDKIQEAAAMTRAEADIQRYAKISSLDRRRQQANANLKQPERSPPSQAQAEHSPSAEMPTSNDVELSRPKSRFRPFHEVLHQIKWDPRYNISDYLVGFLERFEGMKEMPASNWIGDFSDLEWIPMHRVKYVKRYSGKERVGDEGPEYGIVWNRDERIDKLGRGGEVMEEDVLSLDGTSVSGGVSL